MEQGVTVGEELRPLPCPELLAWLWQAFCDIGQSRGFNDCGPQPLTMLEIEAWCRVMRRVLTPWEVRIIKRLDMQYMAHWQAQREQATRAK